MWTQNFVYRFETGRAWNKSSYLVKVDLVQKFSMGKFTVFTRLIVVTIIFSWHAICHDYLRWIIIRDVRLNFKLIIITISSNYKLITIFV